MDHKALAFDVAKRIIAEEYDIDTVLDFQIQNVIDYLIDNEGLDFRNMEYTSQDVIDCIVDRVNLLFKFAEYYRTEVPMSQK